MSKRIELIKLLRSEPLHPLFVASLRAQGATLCAGCQTWILARAAHYDQLVACPGAPVVMQLWPQQQGDTHIRFP